MTKKPWEEWAMIAGCDGAYVPSHLWSGSEWKSDIDRIVQARGLRVAHVGDRFQLQDPRVPATAYRAGVP